MNKLLACIAAVVVAAAGARAQCPGDVLGPCLCFNDGEGRPVLRCEAVGGWEEVQDIFTDYGISYLASVDVINSPGLVLLPPSAFADVVIDVVRFLNTGLQYMSPDVFSPVTAAQLSSLYIKHNNDFQQLDNRVVGVLPRLESLYCSYNALGSLAGALDPTGLPYMDFSHDNIASISERFFASADNVTVVLLPFNQLTSTSLGIDSLTFTGTPGDLYLDLAWNQLTNGVPFQAFGGRVPRELVLSHNNMTTLNEANFSPLLDQMVTYSSPYILLDENPLACDCTMAWVVNHLGRDFLQQAECTDGRLVSSLTQQDFASC